MEESIQILTLTSFLTKAPIHVTCELKHASFVPNHTHTHLTHTHEHTNANT
jgi:hypothetical protein